MKKSRSKDRLLAGLATYFVLFTVICLPMLLTSLVRTTASSASVVVPALYSVIPLALRNELQKPLSTHDIELYKTAMAAQDEQNWKAADEALAELSDTLLQGYILKERFLHRNYDTSAAELEEWLAQYHDLPQAYEVFRLAKAKYPSLANGLEPISKPAMISVMGDDNGLASSFLRSKHYTTWRDAIAAYGKKDYQGALALFDKILEDGDNLSPWKLSAAAYWSWRAHSQLGNDDKAAQSLELAASEPQSFYGLLAIKQLKQSPQLQNDDLSLTAADIAKLEQKPAVIRALALHQIGRNDLAEEELRASYLELPRNERPLMLKLADRLSLPALQISLAKRFETASNSLSAAKFPIPDWEPVGGFNVDPALIYALVRQESGFRPQARSHAGAMGLMQLMPGTAQMMRKQVGEHTIAGASPEQRNVTLGQSYVRHLLDNPLVDNNVIFMLASYNAGIGRLQQWKQSLNYDDDPLLFIEQIPYPETRYYVMQVMTNYWLYSELLGVKNPTLGSLANLRWPHYSEASIS